MAIRKTVQIPVQPWFKDHSFNGQTIFPAVESMLLLAGIAREIRPNFPVTTMSRGSFSKFLPIPDNAKTIPVLVEITENKDVLCLKLLSKITLKKMSRIKEHAEIYFLAKSQQNPQPIPQAISEKASVSIDTQRIYEELVPFGPSYQSLTGTLKISESTAFGTLKTPKMAHQHNMEAEIGSPFPLDGAMHAACVLGQCITDFVPFPVGFTERHIHKPTLAGETYHTTVYAQSATQNELLFNVSLFDRAGTTYETITGLQMRDISRGAIKPPHDLPKVKFSPL